jgi:DNA gyrase subunit B
MSYYKSQLSAKLMDSAKHGAGTELLIVEGESAAMSVAAVRDAPTQAVLPLQGKPLNAWKAPAPKVAESPLFMQLAQALGLATPIALIPNDVKLLRFERIVLLFDPDADGIHIGALVLLYFKRWLPDLLTAQRVHMVRAPMFALQCADAQTGEASTHYAYTPEYAQLLQKDLESKGLVLLSKHSYRGLGSIPPEVLRDTCVAPATRHAHVVTAQEMQAVAEVFGGV